MARFGTVWRALAYMGARDVREDRWGYLVVKEHGAAARCLPISGGGARWRRVWRSKNGKSWFLGGEWGNFFYFFFGGGLHRGRRSGLRGLGRRLPANWMGCLGWVLLRPDLIPDSPHTDLSYMTALPLHGVTAPAGSSRGIRAGVLLTVIVVGALIPRVGFLARPFESDSGLYIYIGKALVEGQTLYRDFYETKTPGVALFTAGLYRVFGDHWWPYVLLQGAMTLVAGYVLARGVGRHLGARAVRPAFAFTVGFLNFSLVAYRGFQLETVQCFFACIAAAYALGTLAPSANALDAADYNQAVGASGRGLSKSPAAEAASPLRRLVKCFLVGVFAGVAAMLKPTAAAVGGAFVLTLVFTRGGWWKSVLVTLAGLLVAPTLVLVWTWRAGILGEMPGLLREISLYGSGTPILAADWMKPAIALLVAGLPFIFVKICRTGAAAVQGAAGPGALLFFASVWFIFEMLGVLLQRRMYIYHFLPLAPPLALLFGYVCQNRRPHVYAVALAPILLLSLAHSRDDFTILLKGGSLNLPESDYLLAHAAATDTVVGDPLERVLMETGLRDGSRYAHLFYFVNHDKAPLEYGRRFIEDLDRHQPTWAVFRTDRKSHRLMQCIGQPMLSENPSRRANFLAAWQQIDSYLAAHYQPAADVGEMTIFRRR